MGKTTIQLILLSCLLTATLSATCGESAWVKSIDTELFSTLSGDKEDGAKIAADWAKFKANVESTDKRSIPDFCAGIVADSEPTCCNTNVDVDYRRLINSAIRSNIRAATKGKTDNCKGAQKDLKKEINQCVEKMLQDAIQNGLPSGFLPSGSGSMPFGSGSISFGSGSMPFGSGSMSFGSGSMPFGSGSMPFGSGSMPFGSGSMSFSGSMPFGSGSMSFSGSIPFGSGSMPSGSGPSMSMPGSSSGPSGSGPQSSGSDKLKAQINATLKLQESKAIKIFADIASKIVPYVRGSVCLICSGSTKANADYWSGTGIYIKQTDYDAIIDAIAESIQKTNEIASGCKNNAILGIQTMNEMFNTTCSVSQDKLDAIESSVAICSDADSCKELAKTKFTTVFNFNVVSTFMATDDTASSTGRRELASSFQVDASQGVSPQPDATEDAQLQIGDQSVESINTENKDAQAEVTAAGGEADLDAVVAENNATLMSITLLLALISCLIY